MDDREAANRAAAEHVERLRERLREGKAEIERQRAAVGDTQEHLTGLQRWIEHTDAQLGEERARRERTRYDDAA
jgi:predicted  nucleic acid-binding Zn-ribbon protein